MRQKRIAFVVQRYGEEINGGAEQHARRIAERLVGTYEVAVITTTALHTNWSNYFEDGIQYLNGVKIYRFHCHEAKNNKQLERARSVLTKADRALVNDGVVRDWIEGQGPNCPNLVKFICEQKDEFEAFLFVTYLFYHTVMALPIVKEKAIFLPTAHDEPQIYYYDVYQSIFCGPKDFLFNSVEEQQLTHRLYQNEHIRNMVVGEGVDTPATVDPEGFKRKMGLEDYIIYVGRVGPAKQCNKLVSFFQAYKDRHPSNLKLVFIGRSDLPKLDDDGIVFTGFITDQEKFDAMASAKCLVMPSQYESLCMAVLEALSVGTPVLVNGKCAVTRGHCKRGNCGLYYLDYEEFEGCLSFLLHNEAVRKQMGENGKKYVEANYNWDTTINRIDEIMQDYN